MRVAEKFVIHGTPICDYCLRAEGDLRALGLSFEKVNLTIAQRAELKQQGFNTIPVIYYGEQLVGGYDQLWDFMKANGIRGQK